MSEKCACRHCIKEADKKSVPLADMFMRLFIICPKCGGRECPHAEDHRQACVLG